MNRELYKLAPLKSRLNAEHPIPQHERILRSFWCDFHSDTARYHADSKEQGFPICRLQRWNSSGGLVLLSEFE